MHGAKFYRPVRFIQLRLAWNKDEKLRITFWRCHAVPFEEDDRDPKVFYVDHQYLDKMWDMFRKISGKRRSPHRQDPYSVRI